MLSSQNHPARRRNLRFGKAKIAPTGTHVAEMSILRPEGTALKLGANKIRAKSPGHYDLEIRKIPSLGRDGMVEEEPVIRLVWREVSCSHALE